MFAGSNICFVFFKEMSTNVVHSLAPAAAAVGEVHAPEEAALPAQLQDVGVEHGALAHINEQMARLQDAADMLNVQARNRCRLAIERGAGNMSTRARAC